MSCMTGMAGSQRGRTASGGQSMGRRGSGLFRQSVRRSRIGGLSDPDSTKRMYRAMLGMWRATLQKNVAGG
eukprot:2098913-Amphidinium_carterae.2